MSKRKRSEGNGRKSITVVHGSVEHCLSWYSGSSGTDLELHLRKKLAVAAGAGQIFLIDDKDNEVVISDALPDGASFKAKIVKRIAESFPPTPKSASKATAENFKRIDRHSDVRISKIQPLIPPALLLEELPSDEGIVNHVRTARRVCSAIVKGSDDRLLVIVGPCSIHDPESAKEYAARLRKLAAELSEDLFIVMRVYFEKPRTTVGWKGLINDPNLDNSFKMNDGLRKARELLLHINKLGVPCGCEFLDTISPQYTADLVTWGAIGARTTESQLHRELSSGMSMPIGFKNGTAGAIQVAADAVQASRHSHSFLGVTTQGLVAIIQTGGNPDCHVILRGGRKGPNYEEKFVGEVQRDLAKITPSVKIMIDCSHDNSRKIHTNQPIVSADVGAQVAKGNSDIIGLMIESHLVAGKQKLESGKPLTYGQSITDACINWDTTIAVLKQLALDVRKRRTSK
jgi:3-deoxy-7-phosphoheptulonate synthase